jgi:magnesium chelatase family protein
MVTRVSTVAFEGIEARLVDVQVQLSPGNVVFTVVGLPDKAVGESRERVRSALIASGLALPAKRITVNLAPADLPKEGSHYDLPIALGVMAAIGAIPADALQGFTVLGELALDGSITAVAGVLPAAIAANERGHGLICPYACGAEAAWASGDIEVLAPRSLIQLANHFKGIQVMARPEPAIATLDNGLPDLKDIKGQESAKRALEIAAAGGHNLLMSGPPGAGKSMLAQRLPSILPPLAPRELLEVSMIQSVAGQLANGALSNRRPFRAPHHSASMAALVGGGLNARPGEVSLAHHGVLFLDEFPEFQPQVLDSLRQPIESGEVVIARANHRVTYPARFQLIAAMNPCRCGQATEPGFACRRQPNERCMAQYQARLSGPLLDRIDLIIEVPSVTAADLILPPPSEGSAEVAARVAAARRIQIKRYADLGLDGVTTNAACPAPVIEEIARPGPRRARARARRRRRHAPLGPRLPSRHQARPHPCRPRRRGQRPPPAPRRGLVLPRAHRPKAGRGLGRVADNSTLSGKAPATLFSNPIFSGFCDCRRLVVALAERAWISRACRSGPEPGLSPSPRCSWRPSSPRSCCCAITCDSSSMRGRSRPRSSGCRTAPGGSRSQRSATAASSRRSSILSSSATVPGASPLPTSASPSSWAARPRA